MAVPHLVLEPRAHQQAARKEDHEQAGTHRLALKHWNLGLFLLPLILVVWCPVEARALPQLTTQVIPAHTHLAHESERWRRS